MRGLSGAQSALEVAAIIRSAARTLVAADGATFVIRENGYCHYVDEDAIGPLWKGRRFAIEACISGLCMQTGAPVAIEDIYEDRRVPHDAYRRTFVRSLVVVPIRASDPLGAIGTYWATKRRATPREVELLCALADTTSVALANVALVSAADSNAEVNRELQSFTAAAAHDLRSPLTSVLALAAYARSERLDRAELCEVLAEIEHAGERMRDLIGDFLRLSRASASELAIQTVDLVELARPIVRDLQARHVGRAVTFRAPEPLSCRGDRNLLRALLENLLDNAWKYTARRGSAEVVLGAIETATGRAFYVRDDGAGFDPAKSDLLFQPFRRLHDREEFEGTGIGLTTIKRIVDRHGGEVWATSELDRGATFFFRLPDEPER